MGEDRAPNVAGRDVETRRPGAREAPSEEDLRLQAKSLRKRRVDPEQEGGKGEEEPREH